MKEQRSQECESPICVVRFEPGGPKVRPKRFCCTKCAVEASLIRRAAKLLEGLSDEKVIEVVKNFKGPNRPLKIQEQK
jgi:hypothetical protein